MATFQAIAAASEAVVRLLRSHYRAELFDGNELEFRVFGPQDFRNGANKPGVSLFVSGNGRGGRAGRQASARALTAASKGVNFPLRFIFC